MNIKCQLLVTKGVSPDAGPLKRLSAAHGLHQRTSHSLDVIGRHRRMVQVFEKRFWCKVTVMVQVVRELHVGHKRCILNSAMAKCHLCNRSFTEVDRG